MSQYQQRNNKYGFDENFNGSSISDQSEDIIIVEPLDEQQQAINKTNALYLTGMHAPYNQNSSIIKPSQSRVNTSNEYNKPNESAYRPNPQQSYKPTYNPTVSVPRKYEPQSTQKQQQQYSQQPLQHSQAHIEPVPRIAQSVIPQYSQTQKPVQQPAYQPPIYPPNQSQALRENFNDSDEDIPQFTQPPLKQSIRLSTQSDQRKNEPVKQVLPRESMKKIPEPVVEPVLTAKEKQQMIANAKQQLLQIDAMITKINNQQYVGQDVCEIFTVQNGRLKVSQDFNHILSNDSNSIVMVGIIGQNKSGKSALMNELAHPTGKSKFGNAGAWMYTKPLIIESKSYYFVDCTTDNQMICGLLMLSCSTLLYNILKLDDNSIWCFPVLDTLQKLLLNEYALIQLLPAVTWVQRDTLQVRPITELQEFLVKANKGHLFENLIKQRDAACIAPQGTSEYQQSISQLKDRIVLGSVCKQVNSCNLNGSMFFAYVDYIAELLNQPKQLQLDQVWINISEEYTKHIYNQSLAAYVKNSDNILKDVVINELSLYKLQRDLKDVSLQQIFPQCFLQNKNRQFQVYKRKLLDVLITKEKQATSYQQLTSQIENENIIEKQIVKLNLKDTESFATSFSNMIDQLLKQKFQLNQCTALAESLSKSYRKLIEDLFSKYGQQQQGNGEDQQQQLQTAKQQAGLKEDELKKKKEQVSLQEKRKNLLIKEIQDLQDQIKLERESVGPDGGQNRESQQQQNEEVVYKLKSQKASNMKEINLLKKEYTEEQRRKKEESSCLIC